MVGRESTPGSLPARIRQKPGVVRPPVRKLGDAVLQEIAKHVMFNDKITNPCRARWLKCLDQFDLKVTNAVTPEEADELKTEISTLRAEITALNEEKTRWEQET